MWKRLFNVAMVVLAACSAEPNGRSESLGVGSSELSAVSLTPWPCQNGVTTWNGSTADLLVADAWTACSEIQEGFSEEYFGSDPYLWQVFGHMVLALATPPTNGVFKAWYDQRQIPAENCDPVTGAVATAPVAFRFTPVLERISTPGSATQELSNKGA